MANEQLPTEKVAGQQCQWHEHLEPEPEGEVHGSCSECNKLLETKDCAGCGGTFLNFDGVEWDDVVSFARVTLDGDVVCIPCLRRWEAREEREAEEDFDDYDPYEAAGESHFSLPGGGTKL